MANRTATTRRLRRLAHDLAERYKAARLNDFDTVDDAMYVSYYEGYIAGYVAAEKESGTSPRKDDRAGKLRSRQ